MRFNFSFAVLVDEERLAKQNHILNRRMERDQYSNIIPDSHVCDNFLHSICVILLVASTYEVEASHVHKYILL